MCIRDRTKMALNLTKRQLICFGCAAAVGIPSYLLARGSIGNTGAMFLIDVYKRQTLPRSRIS